MMDRRVFLDNKADAPAHKLINYEQGKPYFEATEAEARALAIEIPDNAKSIPSPADAPEGADVVQGPKGGWYAVPAGTNTDQQQIDPQTPTPDEDDEPGWRTRMDEMELDDMLDEIEESGPPPNTPRPVQQVLDKWVGALPPNLDDSVGARIEVSDADPIRTFIDHLGEFVVVDGNLAVVYDFPMDGGLELVLDDGEDWHIPEDELDMMSWHEPGPAVELPGKGDPMEMVQELQAARRLTALTAALNEADERGVEIPESVDIRQATAVNGLEAYGIVGGINENATTVAEMPDGSRVFVKDYTDTMLGDGEASAVSASILDEMGVSVPATVYDELSGLHLSEGVESARPLRAVDMFGPEVYWRDINKVVVGGILTGNSDMHGENLMQDRRERIWLVDNDLAGQSIIADTGETLKSWVRELSRRLSQHQGAGDAEMINNMASHMASRVGEERAKEMYDNNEVGTPEYEIGRNLLYIQRGTKLIPDGAAEAFNRRVQSVEQWEANRPWTEEMY